jgi:hypothetical protein
LNRRTSSSPSPSPVARDKDTRGFSSSGGGFSNSEGNDLRNKTQNCGGTRVRNSNDDSGMLDYNSKSVSDDRRSATDHFSSYDLGTSHENAMEEEGDILLSGSDYWRLDSSVTNGYQPTFNASHQSLSIGKQQQNPGSNQKDPMKTTRKDLMGDTMNETGDWNSMRKEGSNGEELDEFALLEQQLEDMSVSPSKVVSQQQQQNATMSASLSHGREGKNLESRPQSASSNVINKAIYRPELAKDDSPYKGDTDHFEREEDDEEQSIFASTSSSKYPNSSGRGMRTSTTSDTVNNSQSWGAVTRPRSDSFNDGMGYGDDENIVNFGTKEVEGGGRLRHSDSYGDSYGTTGSESDPFVVKNREKGDENISQNNYYRQNNSNFSSTVTIGVASSVRNSIDMRRHSNMNLSATSNSSFSRILRGAGGGVTTSNNSSNGIASGNGASQHFDGQNHSRPIIPRHDRSNNNSNRENNRHNSGSSIKDKEVTGKSPKGKSDTEDMQKYLNGKANELEIELATYRKENVTLKQLRKQQETALADVLQQRTEMHKYVVDERQKTDAWCEEQKQAAARDRRASAKLARDSRQQLGGTGSLPLRKERAELEAVQATLEKLRIDHEGKEKKWRMNERRLQQLVKDNSIHSDDLNQQIVSLEQDKQAVWTYLDSIGVRLPGSLIRSMSKKKGDGISVKSSSNNIGFGSAINKDHSGNSSSNKGPHNLYNKDGGGGRTVVGSYVVEVDPEQLEGRDAAWQILPKRGEKNIQGGLANAIFNRTTQSSDDYSENPDQRQKPFPPKYDPQRYQPESIAHHVASPGGRSVLGIDNDLKASWARSSRSSRGSRYNSDDGNLSEEDMRGSKEAVRVSGEREIAEFANTAKAIHSNSNSRHSSDRIVNDNSFKQNNSVSSEQRPLTSTVVAQSSSASKGGKEKHKVINDDPANVVNSAGRTEELLPDGRRVVQYRNGTQKELLPSGESVVRFVNGDSKTTGVGSSGVVVYYYAQANTTHTTYTDGLEVYEFPNNQVSMLYVSF